MDRQHRLQHNQSETGQATVELALMLPLIGALLLLVLQVAVVCQTQLALQNGVREAARACAVDPGCNAASIVDGVVSAPTAVTVQRSGSVEVVGTARVAVFVPLLRSAAREVSVSASAIMREEHNQG